jgi:hypothetical protein
VSPDVQTIQPAGQQIVGTIRSLEGTCSLSVLDVRNCGGVTATVDPVERSFASDMSGLGFEHHVPGFFARPARYSALIENRIVRGHISTIT